MTTFFLYLMKSVLCLALFYPFYMVLLSRETFHRFNRMALISILLASVIIPVCRITTEEPMLLSQFYQRWERWLTGQGTDMATAVVDVDWTPMTAVPIVNETLEATPTFSLGDFLSEHWGDLLFLFYVAGILFLVGRHIASLVHLFGLLRRGRMQRLDDGIRLYLLPQSDIAPFSWMKYIVISEADYRENGHQIVAHEQAHISNRHSWDLLLVEVCLLAQWFNPAAWLFRQELQNIHEYEADDTVLRRGINAKEYQLLIIKKAVGARLYSLANSLNHSSLKKRLTMMMKEKSHPWARLKYLYVLPLAAISMVAFAHTEAANNSNGVSEAKITEVSANSQTSGEKYSDSKGPVVSLAKQNDGLNPIIMVDGKVFQGSTDGLDYKNLTAEDLNKLIGMKNIEQIEVVKDTESLIKLGLDGSRPAICLTTKETFYQSPKTVFIHVDSKGEYSYGQKKDKMTKASLGYVTGYIKALQEGYRTNGGGNLLKVSLKVDKDAPKESVEKLKNGLREANALQIDYDKESEQKKPIVDHLKLNGQPRLNEETNVLEVESAEEVFMVVEKMPEFPGGTAELMKFISKNIKYPEQAMRDSIQGRVIVQFVIDKTGKAINPTIKRSVSPELDAEAIRVVNAMPQWKPGEQRGKTVNVQFTLPVQFRLINGSNNANNSSKKL